MRNVTSLKFLQLDGNQFEVFPPMIRYLKRLRSLYMNFNRLTLLFWFLQELACCVSQFFFY
jgi:Leucine-rich repeat (LRR) protein